MCTSFPVKTGFWNVYLTFHKIVFLFDFLPIYLIPGQSSPSVIRVLYYLPPPQAQQSNRFAIVRPQFTRAYFHVFGEAKQVGGSRWPINVST